MGKIGRYFEVDKIKENLKFWLKILILLENRMKYLTTTTTGSYHN
jgi:hypothetical protein